jgi:uncharacterized protein (TIGR02172 family)
MKVSELRKIAEGREAEIFEWEGGNVLRLMRPDWPARSVDLQADALRAAHDAGIEVPAPKETTVVEGRHGLVMERVDGIDLLTLIGEKPWHIWSAGKTTGRLQAEMHDVTAPEGLPNLRTELKKLVETSELVPDKIRGFALRTLVDLPDGDRLLHGDFHPGNIIQTDSSNVIIDWSNACAGDPHADLARAELMIKLGDPPPGAPFLIRTLAVVGRGFLGSAIRRGYRSYRAVDDDLVRRWTVPVAAHRLTENIEPERAKLLALLEERMQEGS